MPTAGDMGRQRGFTLIEMSMVIAVIGLMVGGGLTAIAPIIEKSRENQTTATMDQIEAALVLYAIQNNRLPCAADGSQTNTSATYGLEVQPSSGIDGTGQCATNLINSAGAYKNAVIPWRTLGMDESYSIDGWGNRISYWPASAQITGVNSMVDNTPNVNQRVCTSDPSGVSCTLCLARTTSTASLVSTRETGCDPLAQSLTPSYPYGNYIAVYAIGTANCGAELTTPNTNQANLAYGGGAADTCTSVAGALPVTTSNVMFEGQRAAYVLISHGQSGWYGWNKAGNQIQPPNANYILKKYNSGIAGSFAGTAGNKGFVQGNNQFINTKSNQGFFDDIVRWRSPAFIIQNCGSGACGNP